MTEREDLKLKLKELSSEIEGLEAVMLSMKAASRVRYLDVLNGLKSQRKEMRAKYEELAEIEKEPEGSFVGSVSQIWDEVVQGARDAASSIRANFS